MSRLRNCRSNERYYPVWLGLLLLICLVIYHTSAWKHLTLISHKIATPTGYRPRVGLGGYAETPAAVADHFLATPDPERKDVHEWNAIALRDLATCMATRTCGPNQQKVAIGAAYWWQESVVLGWRGGEGVWSSAMVS